MNHHSKFVLGLTLITLLGVACKKQEEAQPIQPSITQRTSSTDINSAMFDKERTLFTINENSGYAVLDVQEHYDRIFINNRRPGYGLSHGNTVYTIVDRHGKTFSFTSKTAFADRSDTGLRSGIQILKDGQVIFSNRHRD